jgi:hypothetical protein
MWLHHKFEKLNPRAVPPPAERGKMLWTEYYGWRRTAFK